MVDSVEAFSYIEILIHILKYLLGGKLVSVATKQMMWTTSIQPIRINSVLCGDQAVYGGEKTK